MKIGIFGGSFNPVHSGHVAIAKKAIEDLSLDKLIVIPACVNPLKVESPSKGFIDEAQRLMLVRAAFNGVAKVDIDKRELERGGVSYSIDTVRQIAAENPGAEIFFIVGEDSLANLDMWKDSQELKKLCVFKAYPRTKESSSEIRRRLAANEDISDLVPQEVAMFLKYGVRESDDSKIVNAVRMGLAKKEGFCPCRLAKKPEFFCPCDEFKSQLADDSFKGLCHCRLYFKP